MSEPAWELTIRSLQLSCTLLFAAWLLLLDAGTYSAGTSEAYRMAQELALLPEGVLLFAAIAGAVIEERQAP